ncbi:ribosomal L7Ae/L30e/S12e/Gadd45 family protein [Hazenella sp. IB182357]|uniref:Ribosomal L7Ae/L30e/S12e/Gadd45 family protein n=1 Tax=Polycladospora coralii TaxID=2771432 RepID=A0A926RU16_9BACL|nr:ribosomal L7Ae/L30e/S12e/Gadd45 family protein [Polycladospora coralii]MBD1372373.1 ribosomal L7Ae/L30e/S12e/Gadd45 family protein [Polycladospora coralii]MBS7531437.1 ribosomal L7Ae/L30e/S12e/Gadd45 family protein [Polycladospora coralii]
MSYEKVMQASLLAIGSKQTKKAVEQLTAQHVVLATDADSHITEEVVSSCKEYGIPYSFVDAMKELGKAAGIDVGAASIAILE